MEKRNAGFSAVSGLPDIADGMLAIVRQRWPGLAPGWRLALCVLWWIAMLALALYGVLEPRAEFHYLAM